MPASLRWPSAAVSGCAVSRRSSQSTIDAKTSATMIGRATTKGRDVLSLTKTSDSSCAPVIFFSDWWPWTVSVAPHMCTGAHMKSMRRAVASHKQDIKRILPASFASRGGDTARRAHTCGSAHLTHLGASSHSPRPSITLSSICPA